MDLKNSKIGVAGFDKDGKLTSVTMQTESLKIKTVNNLTDNKELFTEGEWRKSIGVISSDKGIVARLPYFQNGNPNKVIMKEEAEANASLIAESKNMYQNIKVIVDFLDNHNEIIISSNSNFHKDLKEIINSVNKKNNG